MGDVIGAARRERAWPALIVAAMTVLALVDAVPNSRVVPIVLLVLGPLAAAIRLGRDATAGVGGYAFVLAVALGGVGGSFLSSGHLVAMLGVGAAAVLAPVVASVRARLEALQARTAALLARARFLADAGAVLDRSLNPDETLRQIASLAVPERAAMCVIDLAEEDGGVRGVAVEARDEELAEGMRDMRSRFPLDPDGPHPVARVLREERSTLIQLDDPMLSDLAARGEPSVARERSAFLAEAGVLLDQSLDFDTTLADLARLVVPGLADWCSIDVSDADGSLRNVVIAHRDPPREADAKRLLERYPLRPDLQVGAPQVIRTGSAEFLPSISRDVLERGAVDPEHRELIDALDLGAAIIAPRAPRGRILGAVTLVTDGERRLEEADLTLALELGARAGLSVDNARLYGDRTHVAQTLQASLLPPQLPPVPGMRVAARYRPAGEGVEVGGDFYDVFAAGPDRWVLVVGDVCGKGAEAAAVTALARYTLRADAARELPPAQALSLLNAAMLRQHDDGRFLTLAYAVLSHEGDGLRLVVACAGHPPPVVLRDGRGSALLGHPGSLLGIFDDPSFVERSVLLEPGDSAVFYTDGVTEGNPVHRITPDELADLLAPHGGKAPDQLALEVERAAVGSTAAALRDDLAVLVAQRDR